MIENGAHYVYVYGTAAEESIGGNPDVEFIPRYAISLATRGKSSNRTLALVMERQDAEEMALGYAKAYNIDLILLPSAGDAVFYRADGYHRQDLKATTTEPA